MTPRELLLASFRSAVAAADPAIILPSHLPPPPRGRTLVVGGGKAAASMAAAVEAHWPKQAPLSGLVVTRYQHGLPTHRIEVVEASHPLPDGRGEEAARRMLAMADELGPDDLLLALISGGGSSLLAVPVEGVSLKELRQVTKALLGAGASIQDINTVRKHLTQLAGGRLAVRALAGNTAQGLALIISDVVGDEPTHIASGPCAPDLTTCADAFARLQAFGIVTPPTVRQHLEACMAERDTRPYASSRPKDQTAAPGGGRETPKADNPVFARMENRVIGSAIASLEAARAFFETQGIAAVILSAKVCGDARVAARAHAALARAALAHAGPMAFISGGETTVTLRPQHGRGGRNTEFLLALALELGAAPVWAIACDTDGIDGSEDNAGALIDPVTLKRANLKGLDANAALAAHDSHKFFSALGDLVVTGPTRTNVNDYRALLIGLE